MGMGFQKISSVSEFFLFFDEKLLLLLLHWPLKGSRSLQVFFVIREVLFNFSPRNRLSNLNSLNETDTKKSVFEFVQTCINSVLVEMNLTKSQLGFLFRPAEKGKQLCIRVCFWFFYLFFFFCFSCKVRYSYKYRNGLSDIS